MFPIPLPLEDGRPDGTVSDDTSNSSVHESERFLPVSSEDWYHFLTANVYKNIKYKINNDVDLFYLWAKQNSEMTKIQDIPPVELDSLLSDYYGCILVCSKNA